MKKILICILVLILSLGSIFFFFKKNNKKLKVIETNFELPLINNISIRDNVLLVNAGNYVYGDVNQDGYINNLDILAINLMINDDLKYSESQKRLGDLNQDDKINSKDIDILNNYLDEKREYKYDYDKDLVYCINTQDKEEDCKWQESKYFNDIDYELEKKYIYVKNMKTGKVGTVISSFKVYE